MPRRAYRDTLPTMIDVGGQPIPESELPTHYRRQAERLRREADVAETLEMRIMLLDGERRFEELAESFSRGSAF